LHLAVFAGRHRAAGLAQAAAPMAVVPVAANHSHSLRELTPRCASGHIASTCGDIALIPKSTVKPVSRVVSVNESRIHAPARRTSFARTAISLSLGRTSLFYPSKRLDTFDRSHPAKTAKFIDFAVQASRLSLHRHALLSFPPE